MRPDILASVSRQRSYLSLYVIARISELQALCLLCGKGSRPIWVTIIGGCGGEVVYCGDGIAAWNTSLIYVYVYICIVQRRCLKLNGAAMVFLNTRLSFWLFEIFLHRDD